MSEKSENNEISKLWQAMIAGKIDVAMTGFQSHMQDSPEDRAGWVGLIAGFCAVGKIDNAYAIIEERTNTYSDGPLCVMEVMAGFSSMHQLKLLVHLKDNWQETRSDYVFCLYFYAQLLLEKDRVDDAHPIFLECKTLFIANEHTLSVESDMGLFSLYRQCINLVALEKLQDLIKPDADDANHYVGAVNWLNTGNVSTPAIGLAAADRYYAESFGPDFLKALSKYWPKGYAFHLHIVDVPKDKEISIVENLRECAGGLDLRISLSNRPDGFSIHKSAYYASMRFFLIARLIERYNATIITFDIDMIAEKDLSPIVACAQKADYCRYRRNAFGPGGHDYAAITSFTNANGQKMAKLVECLIIERFKESQKHLWFVDQTALFQAWHYCCGLTDMKFVDASFSAELPELDHFFDHLSAQEIKQRLSKIE